MGVHYCCVHPMDILMGHFMVQAAGTLWSNMAFLEGSRQAPWHTSWGITSWPILRGTKLWHTPWVTVWGTLYHCTPHGMYYGVNHGMIHRLYIGHGMYHVLHHGLSHGLHHGSVCHLNFLMVHPVMQTTAYPMARTASTGRLVVHIIIPHRASPRGVAHGIPHGSFHGEHYTYSSGTLQHTPSSIIPHPMDHSAGPTAPSKTLLHAPRDTTPWYTPWYIA